MGEGCGINDPRVTPAEKIRRGGWRQAGRAGSSIGGAAAGTSISIAAGSIAVSPWVHGNRGIGPGEIQVVREIGIANQRPDAHAAILAGVRCGRAPADA